MLSRFYLDLVEIYAIANSFFENCRQLKIPTLSIIDRFRENLKKATETLGLSRFSQQEILVPPIGRSKDSPTGDTSIPQPEIQASPNARSAPPSSPVTAAPPDPSEITAKTSALIPQNIRNGTEKICIEEPDLEFSQRDGVNPEIITSAQVQVLPDTQQETKDQELKSQGQQDIFTEKKFLCGAGFSFSKEKTYVEHQVASRREGGLSNR